MKTRIIKAMTFVMVLTALLMCYNTQTFAASSWYEIDGAVGGMVEFDKESGTITAVQADVTSIEIPETIDDVAVVCISDEAFELCSNLTSVFIPSSVEIIGANIFANCTSLEQIDVDSNNTILSSVDGVLYSKDTQELIKYPANKSGDSFEIPEFVKIIADEAFAYACNLTQISLGENVVGISVGAFKNCAALTQITLTSSITSIPNEVFYGCVNLQQVTILGKITDIGSKAFYLCPLSESVVYCGTMADFEQINIDEDNEELLNANIIYNNTDDLKVDVLENFTATYTAIRVNWEENTNASGYRVYMKVDDQWVKLTTLYGSDTTTYRVSGLTVQTDYEFCVKAFDKSQEPTVWGEYSSSIYAYTDALEVEVLSNFSATLDAIRVNWQEVSIASGYRVYMKVEDQWVKLTTLYGSDTNTFRVSGLTFDTDYEFCVKAFYKSDEPTIWGDYSSSINAYTDNINVNIDQKFEHYPNSVKISWDAIDGVAGYRIYKYVEGDFYKYKTVYGDDISSCEITNLIQSSEYEFAVRAFYKIDGETYWGDYSDVVTTLTTLDEVAINSCVRTSTSVKLTWKVDTYATGYKIYCFDGTSWKTAASIYKFSTSVATITGLKANTSYKFKIVAFAKTGSQTVWGEEPENLLCVTTFSTTVSKPATVTASASNIKSTSFELNWTRNTKCSGYSIYIYNGSKWELLAITYSNEITSLQIAELTSKSTYAFCVAPYTSSSSDAIEGDASNIVYVTTK